jgi:hypothetical protein
MATGFSGRQRGHSGGQFGESEGAGTALSGARVGQELGYFSGPGNPALRGAQGQQHTRAEAGTRQAEIAFA